MTAVLDSRTLLNRVFSLKSPQQLSSSLLPLLGPHLISAAGLLIVTEDLIEPNPALVSVVTYVTYVTLLPQGSANAQRARQIHI